MDDTTGRNIHLEAARKYLESMRHPGGGAGTPVALAVERLLMHLEVISSQGYHAQAEAARKPSEWTIKHEYPEQIKVSAQPKLKWKPCYCPYSQAQREVAASISLGKLTLMRGTDGTRGVGILSEGFASPIHIPMGDLLDVAAFLIGAAQRGQ